MLITSTRKEREQERDEQTALQIQQSNKMENAVIRLLRRVGILAAKQLRETGSLPPQWVINEHQEDFNALFERQYKRTIELFSDRIFNDIEKDIKHFTFTRSYNVERKGLDEAIQSFDVLADDWIIANGTTQSVLVAQTSMKDIAKIIAVGTEEQIGVNAIAKLINNTIPDIARFRARAIAVTETHNAAMFANITSTRQADRELDLGLLKVWEPVIDNDTRDDHRDMLSHPAILLDELFDVAGNAMDRPGDPGAPAEQVINCRCALVYQRQ